MVNQLIQQYLEHPRRIWISGGISFVIGLLFVLPAWDNFEAASTETKELQSELYSINQAVANYDVMQARLRDVQLNPVSNQMINQERADQIREDVSRLVHEMNCQMRRLTLSDPVQRIWREDDHPFAMSAPEQADDTRFQLETRKLNISVDGSLADLSRLTIALTRLSRFAVPTEMTLQRERQNGELRLDVDIALLNLTETND